MCHHLGDAVIDWEAEWEAAQSEADDGDEADEPPEVDIAVPPIGEVEIDEPEIEKPGLDD